MDKKIIIDWIGSGSQTRVAERLRYKGGVQCVYNWPATIEDRLLESIMLRMRANKIRIPPEWLAESVRI